MRRFLPALLWAALVLILAISPVEWRARLHEHGRLHPLYHLIAFCITGLVFGAAGRSPVQKLAFVFCAAVLGMVTEYMQNVFYHLHVIEWWDVWTDLGGVAIAAAITVLMMRQRRLRTASRTEDTSTVAFSGR